MIAEIAGPDQVSALVDIKNDQKFGITKSLVEQAARVEASMTGNTDSFIAAGKGSLESVSLSASDKAQLSEVYSNAASSKSLMATASDAAGEFKSAASIAAISQAEDLKKANSIVQQTKISMDAFNKFTSTKYEGDGTEWQAARKEWLDSEKLRQDLQVSNNMSSIAAQMAVTAAGDISSSLGDSAKSAASDASSSVSETAKAAASDVSSSVSSTVSETAKTAASSVASSVAETAKEAAKEVAKEVASSVAETAKEAVKESVKEAISQSDVDKAWNDYVGLQSQGKYQEAEQARQKMLQLRHEKNVQDRN